MIINKKTDKNAEETKAENKIKKNIFKSFDKKKIIILITLFIIVGIITATLINRSKIDNSITIDIASADISYSYGPNSSTSTNIKVGQEIAIKIMTDNNVFLKCYSTNEKVLDFKEKNKAVAKEKGYTQIYCKNNNSKSNLIDVVVGD